MKNKTEELKKGCGKEFIHNINNQIWICRNKAPEVFIEDAQPLTKDGIKKICSNSAEYFFELCPICEAKLQQRIEDEKEFSEIIEDCKKVIIDEFGFEETKRIRGILTEEILSKINNHSQEHKQKRSRYPLKKKDVSNLLGCNSVPSTDNQVKENKKEKKDET